MRAFELEHALAFSVPFVSALVCFLITALDLSRATEPAKRRIRLRAMTTYGVFAVYWFLLVFHSIQPAFYVRSMPVFVPLAMLLYVQLYRMVCAVTGSRNNFSKKHYIAPAAMLVVVTAIWLIFPIERLSAVIYSEPATSPTAYIVLGICFAYSIVYSVVGAMRIQRFRRRIEEINKKVAKGGYGRQPLKIGKSHSIVLSRLFLAIILDLVVVPIPLYGLLLGIAPFTRGGLVWLAAVLPTRIIHIASCFSLLSDNHIAIETEQPTVKQTFRYAAPRLGRERVEQYIETKKPWLNPMFRIDDMAEDLYSNRAYISAFINNEYGMNFNRFVNGFRLAEVERLMNETRQKRQRIPVSQLIINAGFNNYRSYLRAREIADKDGNDKEYDEMSTLKNIPTNYRAENSPMRFPTPFHVGKTFWMFW